MSSSTCVTTKRSTGKPSATWSSTKTCRASRTELLWALARSRRSRLGQPPEGVRPTCRLRLRTGPPVCRWATGTQSLRSTHAFDCAPYCCFRPSCRQKGGLRSENAQSCIARNLHPGQKTYCFQGIVIAPVFIVPGTSDFCRNNFMKDCRTSNK